MPGARHERPALYSTDMARPLREKSYYEWGLALLTVCAVLAGLAALVKESLADTALWAVIVLILLLAIWAGWCILRGKKQDDLTFRAKAGLPATDMIARLRLAEEISGILPVYRQIFLSSGNWKSAARQLADLPASKMPLHYRMRLQQFHRASCPRLEHRILNEISQRKELLSFDQLAHTIHGLWACGRAICPWSLRGGLGFSRSDEPNLQSPTDDR